MGLTTVVWLLLILNDSQATLRSSIACLRLTLLLLLLSVRLLNEGWPFTFTLSYAR